MFPLITHTLTPCLCLIIQFTDPADPSSSPLIHVTHPPPLCLPSERMSRSSCSIAMIPPPVIRNRPFRPGHKGASDHVQRRSPLAIAPLVQMGEMAVWSGWAWVMTYGGKDVAVTGHREWIKRPLCPDSTQSQPEFHLLLGVPLCSCNSSDHISSQSSNSLSLFTDLPTT